MIKTELIGKATRIYSTEGLKVKHIPSGAIHSEYVLKEAKVEDYEEVVETTSQL